MLPRRVETAITTPAPTLNPNPKPTPNPNPTPTLNPFTLTLRQVILIAFLPQLLENRCVGNCREFAKEMGFY